MYEIRSWRKTNNSKPDPRGIYDFEPTTKIFDQLTFVGDRVVCCFLLETAEGLILIDAMNPQERCAEAIRQGIADIGYTMADLKVILITHAHADHYGLAGKLREESGAKIYMSEGDYIQACKPKGPQAPFGPMDYPIDGYLTDGMDFEFGGTVIRCVETPGHTDHCMSFIFPVTDEGRPHMAALWGGTTLNRGAKIKDYIDSVEKFEKACIGYGVDVAISNHPYVDNGVLKTALVRGLVDGVPNPYVIGKEGFLYYHNKFRVMGQESIAKYPDGIVPDHVLPFKPDK